MKNLDSMKKLISRLDSQQLAYILANKPCSYCQKCGLPNNHDFDICMDNVQKWLEMPCIDEDPYYEGYMPCHNGG